ncbi:MAG: type I-F CRISPR-associated protein Csy2 [Endozoicomonas sp.]|uniref:type I-F CRISPR-associated protein Csy2 n=1 Tax=Endozoicomonas sp. TaxID=1892382 RepID=UPI003D9BBC57
MSRNLLLIPQLNVLNANALSSPCTIGFPAMTAWLGFSHALQRKLREEALFNDLCFEGTGVTCHNIQLHTYKGPGDYVSSIVGTANPLDKDGKRPAFIEEARCHLVVSLVLEVSGIELHKNNIDTLLERVSHYLSAAMKVAGGDINNFHEPVIEQVRENGPESFNRLKHKLMPGHCLLERRDLMQSAMACGQDAMDAMLDYLAVHHQCVKSESGKEGGQHEWQSQRRTVGPDGQKGWIVPVAVGFQAITELGSAKNQRDPDTPHCFAESVVTLGEFQMPYQLEQLDQLIWRYHYDAENRLYLCQQGVSTLGETESEPDGF